MATPDPTERRVFRLPIGRWLRFGPFRFLLRSVRRNSAEIVAEMPRGTPSEIEPADGTQREGSND